jgi:hypothetical protein
MRAFLSSLAGRSLLLALLIGGLLATWPVYVSLHNHRTLTELDEKIERIGVHAPSLATAADVETATRMRLGFSAFYPEPVVRTLVSLPRVQVEAGLALSWSMPLVCLALVALLRRRAGSFSALTLGVGLGAAGAFAALGAILAVVGSLEPWVLSIDLLEAGVRLWLLQTATCLAYVACFVRLHQWQARSAFRWWALCIGFVWCGFAFGSVGHDLQESATTLLLNGVDNLFLDEDIASVASGLLVCSAWLLLFAAFPSALKSLRNSLRSKLARSRDHSSNSMLRSEAP